MFFLSVLSFPWIVLFLKSTFSGNVFLWSVPYASLLHIIMLWKINNFANDFTLSGSTSINIIIHPITQWSQSNLIMFKDSIFGSFLAKRKDQFLLLDCKNFLERFVKELRNDRFFSIFYDIYLFFLIYKVLTFTRTKVLKIK